MRLIGCSSGTPKYVKSLPIAMGLAMIAAFVVIANFWRHHLAWGCTNHGRFFSIDGYHIEGGGEDPAGQLGAGARDGDGVEAVEHAGAFLLAGGEVVLGALDVFGLEHREGDGLADELHGLLGELLDALLEVVEVPVGDAELLDDCDFCGGCVVHGSVLQPPLLAVKTLEELAAVLVGFLDVSQVLSAGSLSLSPVARATAGDAIVRNVAFVVVPAINSVD